MIHQSQNVQAELAFWHAHLKLKLSNHFHQIYFWRFNIMASLKMFLEKNPTKRTLASSQLSKPVNGMVMTIIDWTFFLCLIFSRYQAIYINTQLLYLLLLWQLWLARQIKVVKPQQQSSVAIKWYYFAQSNCSNGSLIHPISKLLVCNYSQKCVENCGQLYCAPFPSGYYVTFALLSITCLYESLLYLGGFSDSF